MKLSERLEGLWAAYAVGKTDSDLTTAELLREAAELARRVEGACTAYIFSNAAPEPHQVSGVTADDDAVIDSLDGKRVALVPVEGGA